MEIPVFEKKILEDKIKTIDYLFNRIITERVRDSMEPKYSLLLGAGCSLSSDIVSAKGIIHMLESMAYLREIPIKSGQNHPFLDSESGKLTNFLMTWYEKNQNDEEFIKFVENQKRKIRKIIEVQNRDEYYREVFYGIIQKRYPQYESMSQTEKKEIIHNLVKEHIDELATDLEYSYWFEQYSAASEDIHGFLAELMNSKHPSETYIFLADLFINKMFSIAFTTNFDDLLGESLSLLGVRSKEIWSDSGETDNTLSKISPNIIKLHGDYMYNNTKNLSGETRKLVLPLWHQLEDVLSKGGLIVIGYSGADNSIMYALEKLTEKYSFPLFWCELKGKIENNEIHWRVKNLIENSTNGYFVKINDFDSFIREIREKYVTYANMRMKRMGEKKSDIYDDSYVARELGMIKKLMDTIIKENEELRQKTTPVPPPPKDLIKKGSCTNE